MSSARLLVVLMRYSEWLRERKKHPTDVGRAETYYTGDRENGEVEEKDGW